MQTSKNIFIGFLVIGFVLLLNACTVVVKSPSGPVQTRSSNSASFDYWYYYPNSRVYYHITERYYYYPDGRRWRRADQLPDGWVITHNDRVRLRISGKPYLKHASHQQKYPVKNTAINQPGKHNRRTRKEYPHQANGKRPGKHSSPHAKEHHTPEKPDHAARGVAKGVEQAPGQAKFDKKAVKALENFGKKTPPEHAKSADAPGKTHQAEKHEQNGRDQKDELNHGHNQANAKASYGKQHNEKRQTKSRHDGKQTANAGAENSKHNKPEPIKANGGGYGAADNDHGKPGGKPSSKDAKRHAVVKAEPGVKTQNVKAQAQDKPADPRGGSKKPAQDDSKQQTSKSSSGDKSSQQVVSSQQQKKKGKHQKQAKQSGKKANEKQQAGKDSKDDKTSSDADKVDESDKENAEDIVVELNVNKGKGKDR